MSKIGLVKEGNARELAQVAWNFANDRKVPFIFIKKNLFKSDLI
jgi:hypothetical protein